MHGLLEIHLRKISGENLSDCGANQFARDIIGAANFAFVSEFELSSHRGNSRINVRDAGDSERFLVANGALFGAAGHIFESADGQALADAAAAIHALIFAREKRNLFDHFRNVMWNDYLAASLAIDPRFLRCDGHALAHGGWIVSSNFGADTVFQRSDDFSARRVVFGVRGEDEQHIERHPDRIALNLDVALLHDIE